MSGLFPFGGRLISGRELDQWVSESLQRSTGGVRLCSAFIKSGAVNHWLEALGSGAENSAAVLVRWRLADILDGASDLNFYLRCRGAGVPLYMRLDFHGKVYAIPPLGIAVGSANATANGLGTAMLPNVEVNTVVAYTAESKGLVDGLFEGATLVDDALFAKLEGERAQASERVGMTREWSRDILSRLEPTLRVERLLVEECFHSDGSWLLSESAEVFDSRALHDLRLLGFEGKGASLARVRQAIRGTKILALFALAVDFGTISLSTRGDEHAKHGLPAAAGVHGQAVHGADRAPQ